MRLRTAAPIALQLCLICASLISCKPQLICSVAGRVADAAAYGNALVVAFTNGTIVYVEDGVRWALPISERGKPITVEPVHPYGILILTSKGWLGLVSLTGSEKAWRELRVDVNAIKRGEYSLAYANGVVAVLVGRNAVFKTLPDLRDAGPGERVLNKYVKCILSQNGTLALLLGINTFCHVCLENDERLLVIRRVGNKTYLVRAELERVKDVGIDENFTTLYVARWREMAIYRLGRERLVPISNTTFPHPAKEWESYGFSPRARFFHYTYLEGGELMLMLMDLSRRRFKRYSLTTAPLGAVHSLVDDEGRVFVLISDPVSRNTTLLCLDPELGVWWLASWKGFARMRVVDGHVVIVTAYEAALLGLEGTERGTRPLSLTVKVVNESGAPISGALVSINSTLHVKTSEEGVAVFTLGPGLYVIEVSSPSYRPERALFNLTGDAFLTIQLERLYLLEIVGMFDNGTVPSLCHIAISKDGRAMWSGEAVNCRALLNVTRGNYMISVRVGNESAEGLWSVEQDTRAVVTLRGTYKVVLRILDEEGVEVENATTIVRAEGGETLAKVRGAKCVLNLPAGSYWVEVSAPGYNGTTLLLQIDRQLEVEVRLKKIKAGVEREVGEQKPTPPNWLTALYVSLAAVAVSLIAGIVWRRRRSVLLRGRPPPKSRER